MSEPSTSDSPAHPHAHDDPSPSPEPTQEARSEQADPTASALTDAGLVLSRALLGVARVLLRQGRHQARKAAESGRARLDLRQLRRDRDVMLQKLGREVIHLVEGGEVSHPGLVRGVERIRQLDGRVAEAEDELRRRQEAARAAARASGDAQDADETPVSGDTEDGGAPTS